MTRVLGFVLILSAGTVAMLIWGFMARLHGEVRYQPSVARLQARNLGEGSTTRNAEAALEIEPKVPGGNECTLPVSSRTPLGSKRRNSGSTLRGIVVHEDGTPSRDALILLFGADSAVPLRATCDGNGRFHLEVHGARDDWSLCVFSPGFLPAVEPALGACETREGPGGEIEIVLTVGSPALAIEGRIVDEDNCPLGSWRVDVFDSTPLMQQGFSPTVEGFLRGAAPVGGDPGPRYLESGTDGRFRIPGLLPRTYTLLAYDGASLQHVRAVDVPAGSKGVLLRVQSASVHRRLRGRVVAGDGAPLGGVSVQPSLRVAPDAGFGGKVATSDANGEFVLTNVARSGLSLWIHGDEIVDEERDLVLLSEPDNLVLRVTRLLSFELELFLSVDLPVLLSVQNDAGAALDIYFGRNKTSDFFSAGFTERRNKALLLRERSSGQVRVPESAATLVLYRVTGEPSSSDIELGEGEEWHRIPLGLKPDRVTVIRR